MVDVDVGSLTFSILEIKHDKDVSWYFDSLKSCTPINSPLIVGVSSRSPPILQEVFEPQDEGFSSSHALTIR